MTNIDYLNHTFESYASSEVAEYFYCKKCKIKMTHYKFDKRVIYYDENRIIFNKALLTCEEEIIKKLLE